MDKSNKLDCLDGLRGIAVLAVVFFHQRLESESFPHHSLIYRLLAPSRLGFIGVHLFLVLSGFCLTYSLIRRTNAGKPPTLKRYFIDRLRRIVPPYYAAIAVYLAATVVWSALGRAPFRNEPLNIKQVFVHLGFIHGLWPETLEGINSPFWSLSLEFQFYAAFPLLFAAAARFGYYRVIATVGAASLVYRGWVTNALPSELWTYLNGFFLGRWFEFALGMGVAARLLNRSPEPSSRPRTLFMIGLLVCSSVLFIGGGLALGELRKPLLMDHLIGAGFACLLEATLLSTEIDGLLGNLISMRGFVFVGTMSYSLYLMHSIVLAWYDRSYRRLGSTNALMDLALLIAAIGSAIAVGLIFYQLVEKRFIRSIDAGSRPSAEPSERFKWASARPWGRGRARFGRGAIEAPSARGV
jgi:peptidoglycan/LPS O-acetylase OafA/YrhL